MYGYHSNTLLMLIGTQVFEREEERAEGGGLVPPQLRDSDAGHFSSRAHL